MRFTHHANERLAERGIDRADVRAVLAAPTRVEDGRPGATNHYGQASDGRAIIVVVAEDMPGLIITVMLDEREEQP
jgi:hypothetical protein